MLPTFLKSSPLLQSLRLLRPYLPRRYRLWFGALAMVGLAVGVLEAAVLAFLGPLTSALTSDETVETVEVSLLGSFRPWTLVGIGLVLVLLGIGLRALEAILVARIGTLPLNRMRDALLRGYLGADHRRQQAERAGELQDLLNSHVQRAGFVVYYIAAAVAAAAMFLVLAAAAAFVDLKAFGVIVGVVVVLFVVLLPLQRIAKRFGRLQNESSLRYAADAAEATAAATEIRFFNAERVVGDELDRQGQLVSHQIFMAKVSTQFTPNLYRSLVLGLLLVGLGALVAGSSVTDFASASTVVLLLVRALMTSQNLTSYTQAAAEWVPFVEEIDERVQQYGLAQVQRGEAVLGPVERVEMQGVGFRYDDESGDVLREIDLGIAKGEKVGLLGHSGSGKSTLLTILLGLYQPSAGRCLVNGRPALDYTAASWSAQVATVPQEPLILTASVRQNVEFHRPGYTFEQVVAATRAAGIHDDILDWPEGYDTLIGRRGVRALSGGQRQRICIARALLGGPSLLVLDEPTSALDKAAEAVVNQTIDALGADCAVVVVSHREAALASCDRLIRLDDRSIADHSVADHRMGSEESGSEESGSEES
ncbi:MAG: ABC-type multidrug transport system fused ATPase/permease subunit [Acidimicrobiales bacterium]|jgi:ABC-type multidrug transport system fused ATPase/permease subunit